MSQPYSDMEAAFWAYLNSQEEYRAFELKEFRGYDGNLIPWDFLRDQAPQSADVPAIGGQGLNLSTVTVANGFQDQVTIRVEMCWNTNRFDGVRGPCEEVASKVQAILRGDNARRSKLGAANIISSYSLEAMTVEHYCHPSNPRAVLFWVFGFDLTLIGKRKHTK